MAPQQTQDGEGIPLQAFLRVAYFTEGGEHCKKTSQTDVNWQGAARGGGLSVLLVFANYRIFLPSPSFLHVGFFQLVWYF